MSKIDTTPQRPMNNKIGDPGAVHFCPYGCMREIPVRPMTCECGGAIHWARGNGRESPITTAIYEELEAAGARLEGGN